MNNEVLKAAYLDTNYVVINGGSRLVIRIGEQNAELDKLLDANGATEWVFVTAYNPFSKQVSAKENTKRQSELYELLERRNLKYFHGFGEAGDGAWSPEPSLLVFGLSREASIELAQKLEQNAIVVGSKDSPPELVFTLKVED